MYADIHIFFPNATRTSWSIGYYCEGPVGTSDEEFAKSVAISHADDDDAFVIAGDSMNGSGQVTIFSDEGATKTPLTDSEDPQPDEGLGAYVDIGTNVAVAQGDDGWAHRWVLDAGSWDKQPRINPSTDAPGGIFISRDDLTLIMNGGVNVEIFEASGSFASTPPTGSFASTQGFIPRPNSPETPRTHNVTSSMAANDNHFIVSTHLVKIADSSVSSFKAYIYSRKLDVPYKWWTELVIALQGPGPKDYSPLVEDDGD